MARPGFVDDTEPRTAFGRLAAWWRRDSAVDPLEWGGAGLLLLALGGLIRQPALAILAVGVLVVGCLARLFWDHALKGLRYERSFSSSRAEIGDTVTLTQWVENDTPFPVGRLDVRESRTWQARELGGQGRRPEFSTVFTLGPYQRAEQTRELTCRHRGWCRLGPTTLREADMLGLGARDEMRPSFAGVLVWPRTVPVGGFPLPALQPLGERRPAVPTQEDPVRLAGVRQYVPGDSLRRIHWRATARASGATTDLQTRVFEPSADPVAMVLVDASRSPNEDEVDPALEKRVVVAASIARSLLAQRVPVGVAANGLRFNRRRHLRLLPGRRPEQLRRVLDGLAEVGSHLVVPLAQLVGEEVPRLPANATIVLVTDTLDGRTQRALLQVVRSSRRKIVLVAVNARVHLLPALRDRVIVRHVDGEEAWDVLDRIDLRA